MWHPKITKEFGKDLFGLLGPKSERVSWYSLSPQERASRLAKIPAYINTRSLGKHPKLIDIVIFCLKKLENMGVNNPLRGIDLPEFDELSSAAEKLGVPSMNYGSGTLVNRDILYKNAGKQRDVFLRHIFEDIIFRFNPGLVFPGIGRMDSNGKLFVNDAQHRTLACIILGIEQIPVNYINSDDEYWDVAQYAGINIHSLSASEFDKYRIRVQRYIEALAARMPIDPEDELSHELHELFEDLGITVAEKLDKTLGTNSLVLTGIGNMIKYRNDYGKDIFTRATALNARMFPTCKFHTANTWGLSEFLKYQTQPDDPVEVDYHIMGALKRRWAKDNAGNQVHSNIKEAYKNDTGVVATSATVPEELIIAHGIYQVCKFYHEGFNWIEPEWNEKKYGPKFTMPLIRA